MSADAILTVPDVEDILGTAVGGALLSVADNRDQAIARVQPAQRVAALRVLKEAGFTHYVFCGGVDWPERESLEVLDHVYSIQNRLRVTVRYEIAYSNPRLPTAVGVYSGADWHERETWEMFGIVFVGHPRLQRLLLAEWQEGFPMRKEYTLPARIEKPWPGAAFEG